jgi:HEAT repeat protein
MNVLRRFFREHPWQRRTLTALLVLIIGCLVGIWQYPRYLDGKLIDELIADDPAVQKPAMKRLYAHGQKSPATVERMVAALKTENDEQFLRLYTVLNWLREFHTPDRAGIWLDRLKCLELESDFSGATTTQPAGGKGTKTGADKDSVPATTRRRQQLMFDLIICGRDNRYVRRALAAAAKDPTGQVRTAAATLAGRLGDEAALRKLLTDDDPHVIAAATLDAGLAGMDKLAEPIEKILDRYNAKLGRVPAYRQMKYETIVALRDVVANCAYALAKLDGAKYSQKLCELTVRTGDPQLRGRLLVVMTVLNNDKSHKAVMEVIRSERAKGKFPPAMALQAAAEMKLSAAGPAAMETLAAAGKVQKGLLESQVIAALDVAAALQLPCRKELHAIIERLWFPDRTTMLVRAARLLGDQVKLQQGQAKDAPDRKACMATLCAAARYISATADAAGRTITATTPHASAAAAVAAWMIEPETVELDVTKKDQSKGVTTMEVRKTTAFYVRQSVAVEQATPGDYVAWRLGRSGLAPAEALGRSFLPGPGSGKPEYDPEVRSCGAILLATLSQTPEQKRAVVKRIDRRIKREDFFPRESLRCALLTAGQRQYIPDVHSLLGIGEFPRRRAITALLAVGDKTALDRLLWNVSWPLEEVSVLLTVVGLDEVFAVAVPDLPQPSAAATREVQLWQMQLMRHAYGIGRNSMRVGWRQ